MTTNIASSDAAMDICSSPNGVSVDARPPTASFCAAANSEGHGAVEAGRRSGVCGKAVHEIAGARAHLAPSHSSQLSFIDDGSEHVSWVVSRASLAPSTGLRISALCTAS